MKELNISQPWQLVIVESPYAGDIARNTAYLRAALRDCLERGQSPYASHGLLTQQGVLDDSKPDERAQGIAAGRAWDAVADWWAFYVDLGWSDGMKQAREALGMWEHRTIPGWEETGEVWTDANGFEVTGRKAWPVLARDHRFSFGARAGDGNTSEGEETYATGLSVYDLLIELEDRPAQEGDGCGFDKWWSLEVGP